MMPLKDGVTQANLVTNPKTEIYEFEKIYVCRTDDGWIWKCYQGSIYVQS